MTYISITNQSKLLGIPREDIIEMMLTGINFLDASITTYVSQINGLEQEIMYDNDALKVLINKMDHEDFKISKTGTLIKIESISQTPSLFFLKETWIKELEDFISTPSESCALIPHRSKGPMFIGEEEAISRLSDSFDGDYDIIMLDEIEKG